MGTCTGTLAAGASCQVTGWFVPTVAGSYASYATLNYRNAVSGTYSNIGSALVLTGQGTAAARPATLVPDVTSINFGSVSVSSSSNRWTAIKNTGDVTATNLSLYVSSTFASQGFSASMGTCGTSLAPGQVCYINITFRPPSRYSWFYGAISMRGKSNTTDISSIDVQLSGYGY
jgi:hypothetical protein